MKEIEHDPNRRRILTLATSFAAGAGLMAASVPFLGYWKPSEKAKNAAAPVIVDISKVQTGSMITVPWQGKPVWILRRDASTLEYLQRTEHRSTLRDPDSNINQQPDYAKNEFRSIHPELLVALGICTHLGCVPRYKLSASNAIYFCPCHGSKFDLAGRVYKGVPAPTNLIIPPHQYLDENVIKIGLDEKTLG